MPAQWLDESATSLSNVELVMLDVEGCLTDGKKLLTSGGEGLLTYSSIDGLGVWLLGRIGVKVAIVSASTQESIEERAMQMGAHSCTINVVDKRATLLRLASEMQIELSNACVVGDDLWDIRAMCAAGVSVCPATARPEAIEHATYRTRATGGNGSVRELADRIIRDKGWPTERLLDLLA